MEHQTGRTSRDSQLNSIHFAGVIMRFDNYWNRAGVTAVFNLTEAGEHPCCGHGLEQSSGFPYLPETFMEEGSETAMWDSSLWQGRTEPERRFGSLFAHNFFETEQT